MPSRSRWRHPAPPSADAVIKAARDLVKGELLVALLKGGAIDLENPDPALIDIETIANNLSKICRYRGNLWDFYSVAQHSVIVSKLLEFEHPDQPLLWLEGLLHDGTEAIMGDLVKPIKEQACPDYQRLEAKLGAVINQVFGLAAEPSKELIWADALVGRIEIHRFKDSTFPGGLQPIFGYEHFLRQMEPLDPRPACTLFLERFQALALMPELKLSHHLTAKPRIGRTP